MYRTIVIIRRLALGALIAAAGTASAQAPSPPAPASVPIDCAGTPFGATAAMSLDLEPLVLLGGASGQTLDELRAPGSNETDPLPRLYRSGLIQSGVPQLPFQTATQADFNGDGRDEVVVAFSDNSNVTLAVYERIADATGPHAQVIQTWIYPETIVADSLNIVAGDLDGTQKGKRHIAVSWTVDGGADDGKARTIVLSGNSAGLIDQPSGAPLAVWTSEQKMQYPRLAVGDFLLDGRDQLVVFGYREAGYPNNEFSYELLEFDTPNASVLPVEGGNQNIGSLRFATPLNYVFAIDDGAALQMAGVGSSIPAIFALDADGGDIVDSAAAELVVHVMLGVNSFQTGYPVLAQRLLHFDTQRDAGNAITAITLGNGSVGFDSSRVVESYATTGFTNASPPSFDAVVADVDGVPPAEIVVAVAGMVPGSLGALSSTRWWAQKAQVRLASGFQYRNDGPVSVGSSTYYQVSFKSTAVGDIRSYDWDFGDGAHSSSADPYHKYAITGNFNVRLTVTAWDGTTSDYAGSVTVSSSSSGSYGGGTTPSYVYRIVPSAPYSGSTPANNPDFFNPDSRVRIGVADVDNDGVKELLTVARTVGNVISEYVWKPGSSGIYSGSRRVESDGGVSDISVLMSDFDGDSLRATLGSDCRRVNDTQLRALVWQPPYFESLQAGADKNATFSKSTSGSSSEEQRAGKYTSNDISGYVGVEVGFSLGPAEAEASIRVTAGHAWEAANGALHGNENAYDLSEGADQAIGEALVTTDAHTSDCYSYDVVRSGGSIQDSAVRMCQVLDALSTNSGTDADTWNTLSDEPRPVQVPLHWIPLQRDWASLALFRPVSASGSVEDADKATDGMFSTATHTSAVSFNPYVEIDLGQVRDIGAIRVFPQAGQEQSLWGFRLYASATPFAGAGVPNGAGISTYQQDTGQTESFYSVWNAWTRDPNDPALPLRARYVRLQYPGAGSVPLNVAEIQVFGDAHAEPQAYPDAVCDPKTGDDVMYAKVFDSVDAEYRTIELRGNLIWAGTNDDPAHTGVQLPGGGECVNDHDSTPDPLDPIASLAVGEYAIWSGLAIGASASQHWDLDQSTSTTAGNYSSIDSSTRIGTEFEAKAGFGVKALAGAAYEFTTGVTQDFETSMTWGSGLAVGGAVGGFDSPQPGLVATCQYYPRPYAYRLTDYSNSGFRHDLYVTDYVVQQTTRTASGAWQREQMPGACIGSGSDRIFANGFD